MSSNILTVINKIDTREELIKMLTKEIDIINSKIIAIVDKLWKIRAMSITLCMALIGLIGLSNFAEIQQNPIIKTATHYQFLLISSLFIPIFFMIIDASYNKRYQLFKKRERCISWFFNGGKCDIEFKENFNTFKEVYTKDVQFNFPVFDIYGNHTFEENHETSAYRSLYDIRPFVTYFIQYVLYSYLVFTHSSVDYKENALIFILCLASACLFFVFIAKKYKIISLLKSN